MAERAAGISDQQRIEIRIGINITIEDDGDFSGDGVNIVVENREYSFWFVFFFENNG
jgi:hypothetical protein